MNDDVMTTVRLPVADLDRAEALVAWVAADPLLVRIGRRPTRSTVLRLALSRGLDILEAEARAAALDTDR